MAKLPTTNISTTLVKTTLGETTDDIGSLCKSEKINKWSKWKPIRHVGISLTDDILKNSDFGIRIPQDFLNRFGQGTATRKWEYLRPVGGENSMFRIGDFRNYVHDARPPFQQLYYGFKTSFYITEIYNGYQTIYLDHWLNTPEGSITINDLELPASSRGIKDCYFGLCLYDENNQWALIATTTEKIGTGERRVALGVDMQQIGGDFWGGYFISPWKLDEQLLYPLPAEIPTADIYFFDGNPTYISVVNQILNWGFPYTFWNTDDFYHEFGQPAISFDTYTYTCKSTVTGTIVVAGGPLGSGREYGHVYFDGKGGINLTPTREMSDFPSRIRTLLLTGVTDSFMNYTPQLDHKGKTYVALLGYSDMDSDACTLGIEYTYVENEMYGVWYARLFSGSEYGTSFSPEFEVAQVNFGSSYDDYTYNSINSIEIRIEYYDGDRTRLVIQANCNDGPHSLIENGTDIPNDTNILIGSGYEITVEGRFIYTNDIPRGVVQVNYYCPHA